MVKRKYALILILLFFITACGNSSTQTATPANAKFTNLSTVSKIIVGSDTFRLSLQAPKCTIRTGSWV